MNRIDKLDETYRKMFAAVSEHERLAPWPPGADASDDPPRGHLGLWKRMARSLTFRHDGAVVEVREGTIEDWMVENVVPTLLDVKDDEIERLCEVLAQTAGGVKRSLGITRSLTFGVRQAEIVREAVGILKWHGYSALVAEYGLEDD